MTLVCCVTIKCLTSLTKIQLRARDLYSGVINCQLTNKRCFLGTTDIRPSSISPGIRSTGIESSGENQLTSTPKCGASEPRQGYPVQCSFCKAGFVYRQVKTLATSPSYKIRVYTPWKCFPLLLFLCGVKKNALCTDHVPPSVVCLSMTIPLTIFWILLKFSMEMYRKIVQQARVWLKSV
jgi:hypothetical protein